VTIGIQAKKSSRIIEIVNNGTNGLWRAPQGTFTLMVLPLGLQWEVSHFRAAFGDAIKHGPWDLGKSVMKPPLG
jgi:hypothetical protein